MELESPALPKISTTMRVAGTVLRVLVGWHFLYEGLVKITDPNWSAAGYLVSSRWLLADLFKAVAENPASLSFVNAVNAWGLTLIGLGLLLGLFTRASAVAAGIFLFLYYIANPPLPSFPAASGEGRYLLVNKNLIELGVVWLLAVFPRGALWSFDNLFAARRSQRPDADPQVASVPAVENRRVPFSSALFDRRELVKNLSMVPVLGAFVFAALRRHGWKSFEEESLAVDSQSGASVRTASATTLDTLKAPAPKGTIGNYRISRLIVGGNLISGFAHARDLLYVSPLLKAYFTDEKVMETLWVCESCGINTAILRTDPNTVRILTEYWKRGGKIQWLAQVYPKEDDLSTNIKTALDNGAIGGFVMGGIADEFVRKGRYALLEKSLRLMSDAKVLAGTAGHMVDVVAVSEREGLPVDFYMKTLHNNTYWSSRRADQLAEVVDDKADNFWDMAPAQTIEIMQGVKKPWIAYKVLAAGAIKPEEGFRYAFSNGADFACVGMFDFQVVNNVNTLNQVLADPGERMRAWMA